MPHTETTVSRRRVLIGTAALALLGTAVSGCGPTAPQRDPALDILTGQIGRARGDSQLAAATATTAPPKAVPALTAVASLRDAHAQALADELTRIGGTPPPTPTSVTETSTTAPATPGAAPAPAPPTPQDVVAALQQSADSATQAATGQSGYRAGLLASIAAACTAAHTVTLAGQAS